MTSETGFPPKAQANLAEGVAVAELLVEQLSYEVRDPATQTNPQGKLRGRLRVSNEGLIWRRGGAHSDLFIPWTEAIEMLEKMRGGAVKQAHRVPVKTARGGR